MEKKLILKTFEVNAPLSMVWDLISTPDAIAAWSSEFSEGTTVEGEFMVGGIVLFKDGRNSGIKMKVVENNPEKSIKFESIGTIVNGAEDNTSEDFKTWIGSYDRYSVSHENGITTVNIESLIPENFFDQFSSTWDKVIVKIKDIISTMQQLEKEGFSGLSVCPLPGRDTPEHTHDEATTHIILTGELEVTEKGNTLIYKHGDRAFFPAGTKHIAKSNGGFMLMGTKKP
jgi:quercetin dioxygenase-like cupin family protein/uncharacterized protein YndB with AHSA1/START domain